MALLATQSITRAGVLPTYSAASANDTFAPGKDVFLHVKNGGGSSCNVTITTPGSVAGEPIADRVVAVPNGSERMIGPFPYEHFADPADGLADVAFSFLTSVTVAVLSLSQP